MCQKQIYMALLNVFSGLPFKHHSSSTTLPAAALSQETVPSIWFNKNYKYFSFMLSLYLYNMPSSHFAYQGVCRLIKAWPVLKERKRHLFLHI